MPLCGSFKSAEINSTQFHSVRRRAMTKASWVDCTHPENESGKSAPDDSQGKLARRPRLVEHHCLTPPCNNILYCRTPHAYTINLFAQSGITSVVLNLSIVYE